MSLKIVFILVNSADPDEMPPYVAFHLGLHCLPKYLFTSYQNEKGQANLEFKFDVFLFLPSWTWHQAPRL